MPDAGPPVLGIPRNYLVVGLVATGGAVAWYLWKKAHAAKSTSSTTVITGSVSSNTGISGQMLNAILKDWQEHPPSSSTSSATGGGGGSTGTTAKKTTKTTSTSKKTTSKSTTSTKKTSVTYTTYTVKAGQSLDEIAKQFGITPAQLAHSNVYVKGELPGNAKVGQTLGTGAGLKTGQTLKIPHYHTTG